MKFCNTIFFQKLRHNPTSHIEHDHFDRWGFFAVLQNIQRLDDKRTGKCLAWSVLALGRIYGLNLCFINDLLLLGPGEPATELHWISPVTNLQRNSFNFILLFFFLTIRNNLLLSCPQNAKTGDATIFYFCGQLHK